MAKNLYEWRQHANLPLLLGLNYAGLRLITCHTEAIDTIFIGKKPLMAYVTSTLIQLANLPTVHIKARGMSIGRAVDVAQIISRKTEGAGYAIGDIRIGSESMESKDGKPRNVSTIEIQVKRNA